MANVDHCETFGAEKTENRRKKRRRKTGLSLHPPKRRRSHNQHTTTALPEEIQHNNSETEHSNSEMPDPPYSVETQPPESVSQTPNTTIDKADFVNAPKKKRELKKQSLRTGPLFSDPKKLPQTVLARNIQEAKELIGKVLPAMLKNGHLEEFMSFLRLFAGGQFPTDNIAFRLFLDVVRWHSLDSTSQMVYSTEVMKFWKVSYRLFHGKFLRFMSGPKSKGQVLSKESEPGQFHPAESNINFAVPNLQSVRSFTNCELDVPNELQPGIIKQAIMLRDTEVPYILSMDGKKVASGLTENAGDIDLFGHEVGPSVNEMKERLAAEICLLDKIAITENGEECISLIKEALEKMSIRIQELRETFRKQSMALTKFRKEAGDDWRKSRFVFAISSIQATIHEIKVTVTALLHANDDLIAHAAGLMHKAWLLTDDCVDVTQQANWYRLKSPVDLPAAISTNTRFIQQRSDKWFDDRRKYRVTGSTIFTAIGGGKLKEQQQHFDQTVNGVAKPEFSAEVQKMLDHGTRNEANAVATLASKVLPLYFPEHIFVEEGYHIVENCNKMPFMLISPDGSLCQFTEGTIPIPDCAVEIKCPFPNEFRLPVHYVIPDRYIPQLLSEMACLKVTKLLYISWTEESSTVFMVTFDEDLWQEIMKETEQLYLPEKPKKPTRLTEFSKSLKGKFEVYKSTYVKFLCEVKSSVAWDPPGSVTFGDEESPYVKPMDNPRDVRSSTEKKIMITKAVSALKQAHHLSRKKATEVLVWLLSDVNRLWHPEIPHSIPVSYAMVGYSLPVDVMRKMHEEILQVLHDHKINTVCSTFDGQWLKLATRDIKGGPLTLLALQKDVWMIAQKMTKKDLLQAASCQNFLGEIKCQEDFFSHEDLTVTFAGSSVSVHSSILEKLYSTIYHKKAMPIEHSDSNDSQETDIDWLPEDALTALNSEQSRALMTEIALGEVDSDMVGSGSITPPATGDASEVNSTTLLSSSSAKHWSQTSGTPSHTIPNDMVDIMLTSIENLPKKRKKVRMTTEEFKENISTAAKINASFTSKELDVIISGTQEIQKNNRLLIKMSWAKAAKVDALSHLFGNCSRLAMREKTVKSVLSLCALAADVLLKPQSQFDFVKSPTKQITKEQLSILFCTFVFPRKKIAWYEKSPIDKRARIQGLGKPDYWFSYPEVSVRNKLEPKCVDGDHLLVNTRVKICKDGVLGVSKVAWHDVASKHPELISKVLVEDLVDKQNNAFAKRTFSEDVETAMRTLGHIPEANFCRLIRRWYQAEDDPGIPAIERAQSRLDFREYLLSDVDFGRFPPTGSHVKGFSAQSFEGYLQSIDTHLQLYAICGTFNQRAVTSLVNETFFSELSELEPTKLGCPKAVSMPRLMSSVTEIMHYRHDPTNRTFQMSTSRNPVYPCNKLDKPSETTFSSTSGISWPVSEQVGELSLRMPDTLLQQGESETRQTETLFSARNKIQSITLRDHFFDQLERKRTKQRKSKISDVSKPSAPSRGCRPVRQYHKYDESKTLPTKRLGIE